MVGTNLLVTGPPRIGKTTLIEAVVNTIERHFTGFFTREIREKGRRTGFSIITLGGTKAVLAHEQIGGPYRVGKYGVNIHDVDTIAVPSMIPSYPNQVVVIDEIGKMECYSALFRETLIRVLDSPNMVLGSIALKGGTFIGQIKERADVELVEVSERNRDSLVRSLAERLMRI